MSGGHTVGRELRRNSFKVNVVIKGTTKKDLFLELREFTPEPLLIEIFIIPAVVVIVTVVEIHDDKHFSQQKRTKKKKEGKREVG